MLLLPAAFERCWPFATAVVFVTVGVVVAAATLLPLLKWTSSMRPPLAFSHDEVAPDDAQALPGAVVAGVRGSVGVGDHRALDELVVRAR